jgi:phosphotransferase system HPr (HPr) family protein
MSDFVASKDVTIANPQGLHARPADLFSRLASRFDSTIEVVKDGQRVDGKSILDILMLAAVEGTTLTIVAMGTDADEAVEALARLLDQYRTEEKVADETRHKQTGSA